MGVERIGRYPYFVALPDPAGEGPHPPLLDAHADAGAALGDASGRRAVLHFGDPGAETKAATEGAALVDGGELAHFLVRGERAPAFLHALVGASVIDRTPSSGVRTFLLDAEGRVMDGVVVLRLPDGPFDEPRFLLRTDADVAAEAADWLRALSDGYVELGAADPYAKVEGPVVVEEGAWTSFTLAGPKAPAVLEAVQGKAPAAGAAEAARIGEADLVVLNTGDGFYEVFARLEDSAKGWNALKEAGATASGRETREALRKKEGIPPAGGKRPALAELAGRAPTGAVSPTKTFFVGAGSGASFPDGPPLPPFQLPKEKLPLRRTPLFEEHLRLTRKRNLVPFAGWEMPVGYTSISE
jgi:glycine cleavage system aminomethyltransferase T